ncbi:MAG: creatininase family protein [Chitinivibrionia bacterium]|nr:creatininase family protein [Chitinivibrionia bacterium]
MSRRSHTSTNELDILRSFDALEVGPVRVEKRRFTAPYTVRRGKEKHTVDLIYRYEEDVFDQNEKASRNLANMIAAQIALNYGLFCDRLVFRGSFDFADRRFLAEMAENTAREIYVKKFLEHNPFVIGPAAHLPAVKRQSYLRAELEFPDSRASEKLFWSPSESRHDRIAVLSSGGKDSLLSYGALNDIGCETHPIFCNESGRHWFTALNAYRHFERRVPHTARVWMNSDRVFAWMLRHFPFIRQDFSSVRSDEYPIRLWTVAVFLFGALPLMRKRGIGRLVVGDEYDTTLRLSRDGITHHNGLYDQSRYFDNTLSRYYSRKRWGAAQFSILRPLSELLIERILVQRYPNLLKHQVSCHATHIEGRRVKPCGGCEKCRRIVGMIAANGGDPSLCGYTKDQIRRCLGSLSEKGLHQERSGAEHMLWMLDRKGLFRRPAAANIRAVEHPEVLKLRFDRERSPMESIPQDMRRPLYTLFLEYAGGAARRRGQVWVDIDPLNDPAMYQPYRFERSKPEMKSIDARKDKSSRYMLGDLTWPEASQYFKEVDVALLPVGSIEQHGPHLPLDTDTFDADHLARSVAERCSDPKPVVLPVIPYGVSYYHDDFGGTISIANKTLAQLVYEIGMNVARNGISKLVIINAHGGNDPALNFAAQRINQDAHIFVCVDSGETSEVDIYSMIDTPNDVHAGEIETSTTLAVRPEVVRTSEIRKFVPKFSSRYLDFTSKRSISWHAFTKKISRDGVMGDPTKASAEKGAKMWDIMITHLVEFVEDLKKLTLDEIFQRRL